MPFSLRLKPLKPGGMHDLPPRTAVLPPSPFLRLTALLGTTPPGEPPIDGILEVSVFEE